MSTTTSAPSDPRAQAFEAIFALLRAGDVAAATTLAVDALARGWEHPVLLNLRALQHEAAGRFEPSLNDLRRAHLLAPRDFAILNACGLCLARLDRIEEALQCYAQALALEPRFGPAWFNSGWAFEQVGELVKAAEAYAKAAELNPGNVQAWANMAWLANRRGDAAATREFAGQALALQPGQPTATLALAGGEADPVVAEGSLRALLDDPRVGAYDRAAALGQLGDALDAQGRMAEAFCAYEESNRVSRDDAAERFEGPRVQTAGEALDWLNAWADRLDGWRWKVQRPASGARADVRGHVFLLGFPRSGTTLMESVLAAHPDVTSLEERNTLQGAVRAWLSGPAALAGLAAATERDLQAMREDYWRNVAEWGGAPEGKIFIDKNPFNTNKLPLIYKLFPDAKVIFAIRDPRDVVLSCFRRRFRLNPSTFELLDLQRAAQLYDRTMRFAETLRRKQDLAEHRLVYERLVEDFVGEASAACAFIGADWRPELADFADRGRRGAVGSASSAQISRGLYADGAGQWRRYREPLAPVLPTLAPWVKHFGYPAD